MDAALQTPPRDRLHAPGEAICQRTGQPHIHLVWTRPIDGVPAVGRLKVARGARAAFRAAGFTVTESIIRPITEGPSVRRFAAAIGEFLRSIAAGRLMPLQCLLFGDPSEARRAVAELPADCDVVYLDGVRCLAVMEAVTRSRPELAILTDFDDLMSRRMSLLMRLDQPPSTGYLKQAMPRVVEKLLGSRWFSRLVLRFEAKSLRQAEQRITALSDTVVLISSEDAAVLRRVSPGAEVRAIPIAERVRHRTPEMAPGPLRFIFVGTDALRQNQLTIDALVDLWRREAIPTPLVIYGQQQRVLELPANVDMAGYVQSLDEIYDGRSVLISPSFLAGGLKTKVLEAFAYATPVLGNRITFEAIDVGDRYPLLIESEAEMLPLLMEPDRFRDRFERAAGIGLELVRERHDPAQIGTAWAEAVHTAIARHNLSVTRIHSSDLC